MATPTQHVAALLKFKDGSLINLVRVEFFTLTKAIWIRNFSASLDGLQEVVIDGSTFEVASVEALAEELLQVRFERH